MTGRSHKAPARRLVAQGGLMLTLALMASRTAGAQVAPPCEPLLPRATATLSELNRFSLGPASAFAPACGMVELLPPWSPFGLAVNASGHLYHDMTVLVQGLPDTVVNGKPVAYHVWLATPSLDQIVPIGQIRNLEPLTMRVDFNKIMIVITAEAAGEGKLERWRGPIAVSGRSRSALMQSLLGHSIFNRAEF